MPMTQKLRAASKKADGILDKAVVGFLGSILAKLPDGVKSLAGLCMLGLCLILTGVFRYFTFDDGWNQQVLQMALDWTWDLGMVLAGIGVADKLLDATPPQDTISGRPSTDVTRGSSPMNTMRDISRS